MGSRARARSRAVTLARGSERSRASLEPALVDEPLPLVSSPLCLGPCRLVQPLPPPAGARPFLFASSLLQPLAAAPSGAFFLGLVVAKDRAQDFRIRDSPRSRFAVLAAPRKCRRHEFPPSKTKICHMFGNTQRAGDFGGKFWWEKMAQRRGELQSCWGVTMKYKQRMNLPWLTSWSSGAREFPLG